MVNSARFVPSSRAWLVKKTSPHSIVCTQNQLESGSVPLTSRFSSWVGKLVTKSDADCLYKSTFGWIMSWTPC